MGQMIERRNRLMDKRCDKLLKMLREHGLGGTILKGQGIALLYAKELRPLRQSGDIDVYVDCGIEKALAFAKSLGQKEIKWDYKHLHLKVWDDTAVEMHYRVEVLLNLWKNWRLQKWFKTHTEEIFGHAESTENAEFIPLAESAENADVRANTNLANGTKEVFGHAESAENADVRANTNLTNDTNGTDDTDCSDGLITPTVGFNVFYILLHIYRHFLYEGVGIRQIVDYYFVLKNLDANLNLNESYAYKAVSEFGMEKFAKGLMWVMHEVLGMPSEWMLWDPDQKEGEYILKQVMKGGNFGRYDDRLHKTRGKLGAVKSILKHNAHLLTHYPSDTIWSPVWIVWHKLWKIKMKASLRKEQI